MVQKKASTKTTFPQFDDGKSLGPKSAGESVPATGIPSPVEAVPAPVVDRVESEVDEHKPVIPTFPVAIINL